MENQEPVVRRLTVVHICLDGSLFRQDGGISSRMRFRHILNGDAPVKEMRSTRRECMHVHSIEIRKHTASDYIANVKEWDVSLSDERRSSRGVVLERRRDLLLRLVVASETVDTGLDEDETELGVLVLPVDLQVLADGDRLFDEVPKVLWDGRCQAYPQTKGI